MTGHYIHSDFLYLYRMHVCTLKESVVLFLMQTDLYKDDWIGLRALDEAGKVSWLSLPGGHLHVTEAEMITHIVPYLVDPMVAS